MNSLECLKKKTEKKITEIELETHKRLMSDLIYAAVIPDLLDIKGPDPRKALKVFRENQISLLEKYGVSDGHIDFDGNIYSTL